MRHALFAIAIAIGAAATSWAAEPTPAPELKPLAALIGTWDETMSNKAAEWTPKAEQSTSVTKKSWALGGKFIRMQGVWLPAKTEFESFLAYDPATKEFRNWYFDSAGGFIRGIVRGTWDEKTRTITWSSMDEFNNKTTGYTKIIDDDHHDWVTKIVDPHGKVLLDIMGKNTRRKP